MEWTTEASIFDPKQMAEDFLRQARGYVEGRMRRSLEEFLPEARRMVDEARADLREQFRVLHEAVEGAGDSLSASDLDGFVDAFFQQVFVDTEDIDAAVGVGILAAVGTAAFVAGVMVAALGFEEAVLALLLLLEPWTLIPLILAGLIGLIGVPELVRGKVRQRVVADVQERLGELLEQLPAKVEESFEPHRVAVLRRVSEWTTNQRKPIEERLPLVEQRLQELEAGDVPANPYERDVDRLAALRERLHALAREHAVAAE